MTTAAAFAVPSPPKMLISDSDRPTPTIHEFTAEVAQWVERVNTRAGRTIVNSIGGRVRLASSNAPVAAGKVILIIDGGRATSVTTFHVLDRIELTP